MFRIARRQQPNICHQGQLGMTTLAFLSVNVVITAVRLAIAAMAKLPWVTINRE